MRSQLETTPPYSGADMVADANEALQSIATNFAGPTDPAAMTWPYATWADTGNGLLKRRNAANTAWVTIGPLLGTLLAAASNLSDVASAPQSLLNLGAIGTLGGKVFNTDNCTIIKNAQGIAARFENGLQIATGTTAASGGALSWITTAWGAYAGLGSVCQFAAAFVSAPYLVGMFCSDGDVAGRSAYVALSASPNTIAVASGSYLASPNTAPGAGSSLTLVALAIGYWK